MVKTAIKAVVAFALCALPMACAVDQAPTEQSPEGLFTETVTTDAIVARYHTAKVDLVLRARAHDGVIDSSISRGDGAILTQLTTPNAAGARADGLAPRIEVGRVFATERVAALKVNSEELTLLKAAYRDAADRLYGATAPLRDAQIRFVIGYHASILLRVSANATTPYTDGCTPCDEANEDPSVPFHCAEDHPDETYNPYGDGSGGGEEPTYAYGVWGYNLQGGDRGCCGNYSGECRFAHPICHAHDWACSSCGSRFFCGWQCKPDAQ
jgi:hypothetical protein